MISIMLHFLLALTLFARFAVAYFRMSCGLSQTGRIDPVVNPGKIAGHVHKLAGASSKWNTRSYQTIGLFCKYWLFSLNYSRIPTSARPRLLQESVL